MLACNCQCHQLSNSCSAYCTAIVLIVVQLEGPNVLMHEGAAHEAQVLQLHKTQILVTRSAIQMMMPVVGPFSVPASRYVERS